MSWTNDTPVWFMDVDGVLNIFPSGTPPQNVKRGEATPFITDDDFAAPQVPITWKPHIVDRIRELHESGAVKVVWLTTWGRGANYGLHELIGFPQLDVVADPEEHPYRGLTFQNWWKAHAVRNFLEKNSPSKIIWTDDDLGYHKNTVGDIYEKVDALMISPNERRGITEADLHAIEEFLANPDVQTSDDGIV